MDRFITHRHERLALDHPTLHAATLAVAVGLVCAVGYFWLSMAGLSFVEPTNEVAVVWPASGFALGALLLLRRGLWPAAVVGVFVGNLLAQFDARGVSGMSVLMSAVNAVAALAAVAVFTLAAGREFPSTFRPTRYITALFITAVVANAVSSALGALVLWHFRDVSFVPAWRSWFFADGLGYLIVGPLSLAFVFRHRPLGVRGHVPVVVAGCAALVFALLFADITGLAPAPLRLLVLPVLVWSALHIGMRVTAALLATVALVASFAVANWDFSLAPGIDEPSAQLLGFQVFLSALVACVLMVAAVAAESRENERTMKVERERVASILRAATEYAIIGVDRHEGTIRYFNPGAEKLLGYTSDEVVGTLRGLDLHVPEEIEARRVELGVDHPAQVFSKPALTGDPESRRWTYRRKDGSHVQVMLTITPERDLSGRVIGYIGMARDLTEQDRSDREIRDSLLREREMVRRLEASDEVRSEFVSTVSHELRTPLTNVVGYSEMLLSGDFGPLPVAQRRALAMIEGNGRRLLDLVENLLTLNGMDAGRQDPQSTEIALDRVLRDAIDAILLSAEHADIGLVADIADGAVVRGDAGQLERVFVNLLQNAIKFTPQGGEVAISLVAAEEVRITIADTGVGIPSDELAQVFDRFFRSNDPERRSVPGTGLGLPIARGIIEMHDGRISLDSELGHGTTVTIVLPATLDQERRAAGFTLAV